MDHKWYIRFMEVADQVSTWSKDPSTKCGCVIVNEDKNIVGVGYNGFPRGVRDYDSRYNDRPLKYLLTQHAETNALANATTSVKGCIALITAPPCANCAGALINAGIREVVYQPSPEGLQERFKESFAAGSMMFDDAGVIYSRLLMR